MSARNQPPVPRLLALAISLAIAPAAMPAQPPADAVCPLGSFSCPVVKDNDFLLCRKNDLLDFYVAGLPTTGDPEAAPSEVTADTFNSPDGKLFHLDGHASLNRLDQLLRADQLTYDADSTAYQATGAVRYQDRGLLFSATGMHGTTEPRYGVADNVQYQLLDSRGNGRALQAQVFDTARSSLRRVSYSTCDLHQQVWNISAKSMTLDRDSGVGRAKDLTLRMHGVPFLWLPYLRFPIDHRRQSGFLYPSFGKRSRAGAFVSLPLYWNIAPNFDATLTPTWYAARGTMLGTEFRYLTRTSKGQLNLDYMAHDKLTGRERGYLQFSNRTYLPWRWRWDTSLAHVTDKSWFLDYGEFGGSTVQVLGSSSYLSRRGSWWNLGAGADVYQITDPSVPDAAAPYRRLPRVYFRSGGSLGGRRGLDWSTSAEAVRFADPTRRGGDRFDIYPNVVWPLRGAAWFLRPELGFRYTTYNLPNWTTTGATLRPSRAVPIFDLDTGLVFERKLTLFGDSFTQTLEPRMYYLRVPYRNQDALPRFDTIRLNFDFWQLFTTNRFSGADRQADANNLTLAVTTRFLDAEGVEKASASVGQIHYFSPLKVSLSPGGKPYTEPTSDYAANLTLALNDNWRLLASQLWDPVANRTDLSSVGLQRRLWGDGIFNLDYRYRRGMMEHAGFTTVIPLGAAWKLVSGYRYSFMDQRAVDAFGGIEWDSCCTRIQLVSRRYVYNVRGDYNHSLMLEVEFKGLGGYGQTTGNFLRNAILGYQ